MHRSFVVVTILLMSRGVMGDNGPKIKTNKDGSQVYQYQNGTTCIKQADYATERTLSGKASITKVFSAEANSSQKVVDALSYSPSVSAVHAALFDMCTAYGGGTITKQEYDEERDVLAKLQVAVIQKEAGQNLAKPVTTTDKPSGSDATSTTKAPEQASDPKLTTNKSKEQPPTNTSHTAPLPSNNIGSTSPAESTKTESPTPKPLTPGESTKNEIPTPKPLSPGLDPHYEALMKQYAGDEAMLAKMGEEAFSRLDYRWTIKFLEQASTVQSAKVWERDYPYLAAAYLLGNGDRDRFQEELQEMLAEMRLNNSYLHHSTTIGMALQNLSNVRQYLDPQAQKYIDEQVVPVAIGIKRNV
jgi:hypothetical protein